MERLDKTIGNACFFNRDIGMVNRILLTGAGFSANFGAPLASQMSDRIYNDFGVQNSEKLKSTLSVNFDYEAVYQDVIESEKYSKEEKQTLVDAVRRSYEQMDEEIIRHPDLTQTYSDFFKKFLFRFATVYGGAGYIFTLNQDLLVERRFSHYPDSSFSSLCLPIAETKMFNKQWSESLGNAYHKIIPAGEDFEKFKEEYEKGIEKNRIVLSYVKLHGSQEWFLGGNNPVMVVGRGKKERISFQPLLRYYWSLFEREINKPNTKLLIIGYSFNDDHVNDALISARRLNGLEITVINRSSRKKIFDLLNSKGIDGLIGKYYEDTLLNLLPTPPTIYDSANLKEIQRVFFGNGF